MYLSWNIYFITATGWITLYIVDDWNTLTWFVRQSDTSGFKEQHAYKCRRPAMLFQLNTLFTSEIDQVLW